MNKTDNASRLLGYSQPKDVSDIKKGIEQAFQDDERNLFVTKKTFSPSKLAWGAGGCPRHWFFLFNGVETKETISVFAQNNMQNGTDSHARLQSQIVNGPLDTVVEEQLQYNDPPINSYCDVIVEYQDQRVPIEIKTCNDLAFEYRENSGKAADYHILQLLVYMKILGSKLGFILYENKNDYRRLMIPVRMDAEHEAIIENAFEWMRQVRKAYDENNMPTYFKGRRINSKICKNCNLREECDSAGQGTVELPLLKNFVGIEDDA